MRWIDTLEALETLVSATAPEALIIDTEYDNQYSFDARLALVQLAWPGGSALIDPLALGAAPLELLTGWGGGWISHDGTHDWWLLEGAGWAAPPVCWDTQIAARLLGYQRFGLAALAAEIVDVELDKSQQRSDWLRRPLSAEQRQYAIDDVLHLATIHDHLGAELARRGLTEAWRQESAAVLERARSLEHRQPKSFYRIKGMRGADPAACGRAQAALDWRFAAARSRDLPEFRVLRDVALVALVRQRGRPREASLRAALAAAEPLTWPRRQRPSEGQQKAAERLKKWRIDMAVEAQMEAAMILPPRCLEALADGAAVGTVLGASSWRLERFGEAISAAQAG